MKRILFFVLMIILVTSLAIARPYNIIFKWDANTESDLAGYRLYQSEISKNYTNKVADVSSDIMTCTINTNITTKQYFALTAYDTSNNESNYSDEVFFLPDLIPPNAPLNFQIQNVTIIIN